MYDLLNRAAPVRIPALRFALLLSLLAGLCACAESANPALSLGVGTHGAGVGVYTDGLYFGGGGFYGGGPFAGGGVALGFSPGYGGSPRYSSGQTGPAHPAPRAFEREDRSPADLESAPQNAPPPPEGAQVSPRPAGRAQEEAGKPPGASDRAYPPRAARDSGSSAFPSALPPSATILP